MRLGRPARGQPTGTLGREDQRAAALSEEGELELLQASIPELEHELGELLRHRALVPDAPELRQALLVDAVVSYEFDDIRSGVVEIERPRRPAVEVQDNL